jgi:phosphatidate phosphatase
MCLLISHRLVQILVDLFIISIIGSALITVYKLVDPNEIGFYCNEIDIFYPVKSEIISLKVLLLFGLLGTSLTIIFIECISTSCDFNDSGMSITRGRQILVSTYHGLSLFFLGASITSLLTEIGKRWIGRLRPHFIKVCQPDISSIICSLNNTSGSNLLYNYIETSGEFCKETNLAKVKDARLSFPSGHASHSCYTMVFLIIYLQARFITLRFRYVKVLFQLTAFVGAYIASTSRIRDHHHRASDVLGGALLGTIIAFFVAIVNGKVLRQYGRKKERFDFDEAFVRPLLQKKLSQLSNKSNQIPKTSQKKP